MPIYINVGPKENRWKDRIHKWAKTKSQNNWPAWLDPHHKTAVFRIIEEPVLLRPFQLSRGFPSVTHVFPFLPTHKKTKSIKTIDFNSSLCHHTLNFVSVAFIAVGMVVILGQSLWQFHLKFRFFKNNLKIRRKIWHHLNSGGLSSGRRQLRNKEEDEEAAADGNRAVDSSRWHTLSAVSSWRLTRFRTEKNLSQKSVDNQLNTYLLLQPMNYPFYYFNENGLKKKGLLTFVIYLTLYTKRLNFS